MRQQLPGNDYSVFRVSTMVRAVEVNTWFVVLSRLNTTYRRQFGFSSWGGDTAANTMARAYRDALIRLVPPGTTRQLRVVPTKRNRSSVPGVFRSKSEGKYYWIAILTSGESKKRRKFSVSCYGEEGAKAKAIAARGEILAQIEDRFRTQNAGATELANELFESALNVTTDDPKLFLQTLEKEQKAAQYRVALLDQWFDAIRPWYVRVTCSCTRSGEKLMRLSITCENLGIKPIRKFWGIGRRSLEDTRLLTWDFIVQTLTDLCGQAWCEKFSHRYRNTFMAVDQTLWADEKMYFSPPDRAALRNPPAELAPFLEGFSVPLECMEDS